MKLVISPIKIFAVVFSILVLWSSEVIYDYVYVGSDYIYKTAIIAISLPIMFVIDKKKLGYYALCELILFFVMFIWSLLGYTTVSEILKIVIRLFPILILVEFFVERHVNIFEVLCNCIIFLIILSLLNYALFDLGILGIPPSYVQVVRENGEIQRYTNYLDIYYRWHGSRKLLGRELISANGFWHEPGAYQIYINLALYFELFKRDTYSRIRVGILLLACISSTSTMGIILSLVLIFLALFRKSINSMKMRNVVITFIVVCVFAFLINVVVTEKIGTNNWVYRVENFQQSFLMVLNNPILGSNYHNVKLWSGLLAYFIQFGILGLIPCICFYRGVRSGFFGKDIAGKFAITAWWMLSLLDENYGLHNIIFFIYALCICYGSVFRIKGTVYDNRY